MIILKPRSPGVREESGLPFDKQLSSSLPRGATHHEENSDIYIYIYINIYAHFPTIYIYIQREVYREGKGPPVP